MASDATLLEINAEAPFDAALQHSLWRSSSYLSRALEAIERFLAEAGFDRGPWLAVAFAAGIALWFELANRGEWLALICICLAVMLGGLGLLRGDGRFPYLRLALTSIALMLAAGCLTVWTKSALVGAVAINRPLVSTFEATVLDREEQPAQERVRLMLEAREPNSGRALKIRLNLPVELDQPGIADGARLRLRARLMPPAPPMLPGSYDFARSAWFAGLAATGSVLDPVVVLTPGDQNVGWLRRIQTRLARHVRANLGGSEGTIASAFASGDRGAIAKTDEDAMRDAGLTHLLSISGLHVSAVIAGAYLLSIRLLALWPWLALRVRLPLAAAAIGALTGAAYTLLTGAEVPTVRSCLGAVLVLIALALGREPLSVRLLAIAAILVMLPWPEAVVGPSFQMSFASVLAIVAVHGAAPTRAFLARRENESWLVRVGRNLTMLLVTGIVIELALMPIAFYHFHRAGIYGALANVIAIPLTTFVSMPMIALALFLDLFGAGAPAWWAAGKSLQALLALAHWTAARPGAVNHLPAMGEGSVLLFAAGGLWLALWRGNRRLWGLVPVLGGVIALALLRPPDLLVSNDGHHVGITGMGDGSLLMLRDSRTDFARDNLTEVAGLESKVQLLEDWPGARCNRDFCALEIVRAGREWRLLLSRGRDPVAERALDAACERVDIVIADRWLPRSCHPAWLKADRAMLDRTGGLAIDLGQRRIEAVGEHQGDHGWWRGGEQARRPSRFTRPNQGTASLGTARQGTDRQDADRQDAPAQLSFEQAKAGQVASGQASLGKSSTAASSRATALPPSATGSSAR